MIVRSTYESETAMELKTALSKHFQIFPEVEGVHSITGKERRIDFVITPKPHLENFPDLPVGVEIKAEGLCDGNKKMCIELMKQAIDYRYTRFKMKTGLNFLPLILLYPPVSNYLKETEAFNQGFEYVTTRLLGKFFIGELVLHNPKYEFLITLCGLKYYAFNGAGKRWNSNWGFEQYEDAKADLRTRAENEREYDEGILDICHLLGI